MGIFITCLIVPFFYPANTGNEFVHLAQHTATQVDPAIQQLNKSLAEIKDKIARNHERQAELAKLKQQLIEDISAAYDANSQIALRKEFHRTEAKEYAAQRSLRDLLQQKEGLEAEILSVEDDENL